eukprot:2939581-Pyramimonas_sp.AAC.1
MSGCIPPVGVFSAVPSQRGDLRVAPPQWGVLLPPAASSSIPAALHSLRSAALLAVGGSIQS